jgi:hypothetical protein
MAYETNASRILVGKSEEGIDVGARIILKLIVEKYDGVVLTVFSWLRIGINGGLL